MNTETDITKQQVIDRLNEIRTAEFHDNYEVHHECDWLLLEYLASLGETEIVDAWKAVREEVEFWYS